MKTLVVGGAGYIGSHIVQELCEKGHEVIVFDNFSFGKRENVDSRARIIEGDIRNAADLKKVFNEQVDVVYHFAAYKAAGESMTEPGKYALNNIAGTLQLIDIASSNDVKAFIFSSSAAVYGDPQYLPIDEKHPKNPVNYYGYTKLAIEENLRWFSELKGMHYAALRYFNATGYDVKGNILGKETGTANLSPIVMEALCGMRDGLQIFGDDYDTPDGTCIRDYIHVSDLADAHLLAMEYLLREEKDLVVNLGTGSGQSVLEVISAAEEAAGKKLSYKVVDRRAGDPANLIASSGKAKELLGWEAKHSSLEKIFQTMMPVYFKD